MDIVFGDEHFQRSLVDFHVPAALTIGRTILPREGVCKNRRLHSGACLPSRWPCSLLSQRLQSPLSQPLSSVKGILLPSWEAKHLALPPLDSVSSFLSIRLHLHDFTIIRAFHACLGRTWVIARYVGLCRRRPYGWRECENRPVPAQGLLVLQSGQTKARPSYETLREVPFASVLLEGMPQTRLEKSHKEEICRTTSSVDNVAQTPRNTASAACSARELHPEHLDPRGKFDKNDLLLVPSLFPPGFSLASSKEHFDRLLCGWLSSVTSLVTWATPTSSNRESFATSRLCRVPACHVPACIAARSGGSSSARMRRLEEEDALFFWW